MERESGDPIVDAADIVQGADVLDHGAGGGVEDVQIPGAAGGGCRVEGLAVRPCCEGQRAQDAQE